MLALVLLGDPADPHQHLRRRAAGRAGGDRRRPRHGPARLQVIARVELPLAIANIFGGIRTSAVNVVATATIAPLAGVLTLGDYILSANVYGDEGRLAGRDPGRPAWRCRSRGLFALLQRASTPRGLRVADRIGSTSVQTSADSIQRREEARMRRHPALPCSRRSPCSPARFCSRHAATTMTTTTIHAPRRRRPRSDQEQLRKRERDDQGRLEELHRGVHPRRDLRPGATGGGLQGEEGPEPRLEQIALKALQERGDRRLPRVRQHCTDLFLRRQAADIPTTPQQAVDEASDQFAEIGLNAFDPAPFTSANAVGMLKKKADELGVTKVSDLKGKSQDLTLYGSPECRQRPDCLVGLQDDYGLKFKKFTPVDIGLRYEVLDKGQADAVDHLHHGRAAGDPQGHRDAGGRQARRSRPATRSSSPARRRSRRPGPDLQKTIEMVQQGLTEKVMRELNARVDVDRQTPKAVAQRVPEGVGLHPVAGARTAGERKPRACLRDEDALRGEQRVRRVAATPSAPPSNTCTWPTSQIDRRSSFTVPGQHGVGGGRDRARPADRRRRRSRAHGTVTGKVVS